MPPTADDVNWPGVHGVRLTGEPIAVGYGSGTPLTSAEVRFGVVAAPDGDRLWSQPGEAGALFRRPDGRFVLTGPTGPQLEVDVPEATITVAPGKDAVQRQLVASFGVPLLLHGLDVLMVHGSACVYGGEAVVVCADSGSGKSSVLVRLVDEGWQSVSEDLCVIDLRPARPQVWPGPPWVRVHHGEPGPVGVDQAFTSADKDAWDVSATHATAPTAVARVVLLDAPGGESPVIEPLPHADALRVLARHAVWLHEPADRGRHLFGPVAKVASSVPAVRVRLPRRAGWRDGVAAVLASAASAASAASTT
ncbi:MAG TPA: hypothetical protein VHC63_16665 [Acidimicrobiales bacterium]|nr:hypothetical protein [Acidimicrobiales bacterium]